MSLKSLEGLPEEVAKLYKQGEDGEFHLENDGLKSALAKERERANNAEKALKDREKTEAEEKARKEREDLERKGEYEKLSAADKAALRASEERAQALESRLRNGARDRAAMEAITASGGIPKALLPHITGNLEVVPDGEDYRVVVKGNPGQKLADYVASLKEEMPWGFNASGMSGGGTSNNNGGGSGSAKTMARSKFEQLSPSAQRDFSIGGGRLTD